MARKVILDVDPGVADTLAICMALADPRLEVVAITATGGVVAPDQATRNVQAIVEQIDPVRLPRIGAADPNQPLRAEGRKLYGTDGLCGARLRVAELHHCRASTKVIADAIRASAGDVTFVAGGPLSNLAAVLRCEPDLVSRIDHVILVGGTLEGPGDVTAAAERNIFYDAEAARMVFASHMRKTMLPLDVTSTAVLRYDLLDQLPDDSSGTGRMVRMLLPGAFRAFHQQLGMEGIYVPEAVAIAAMMHPEIVATESLPVAIETTGDLTYGATVVDRRPFSEDQPNVEVAVQLDADAAVDCILRRLLSVKS